MLRVDSVWTWWSLSFPEFPVRTPYCMPSGTSQHVEHLHCPLERGFAWCIPQVHSTHTLAIIIHCYTCKHITYTTVMYSICITCMILAGFTLSLVQVSRCTKLSFNPGTRTNLPLWILCTSLFNIPSMASHPKGIALFPCLKRLGFEPCAQELYRAAIIDFSYKRRGKLHLYTINRFRSK